MRAFDVDIVTELAKEEARAFWLVECQFSHTFYFTDCDIDLIYDGNKYQSDVGCNVTNVRQGASFSVDKVTIEFGNVGLWMSSIVLNEDVANDNVIIRYIMYASNVPVVAGGATGEADPGIVMEDGGVVFEDDGGVTFEGGGAYYSMIGTPAVFFNGFVTDWSLTERTARLNLASEFMLWRKKTLRLPTPSCPWNFKGAECGYSGAQDWCDKSVERCSGLANYDNFGGRRYIASLETAKLWWGNKGYGPQ